MATSSLSRLSEKVPSVFDDFFKPWNEWFNYSNLPGRVMNIPAVNITENANEYLVSLAVPGMKKDDFSIDVEANILTISSKKEESKEEEEKKFTRKEYSYTSFSRSFSLPDEIEKDKIEAKYEEGVLKISLPRKTIAKENSAKQIAVR